ncbi:unnamed protein product [Leuciscus chuanchicus]
MVVCMRALPLLWKFREKYKHHLVLPGQFHTAMNYLGMITNHNYHGSGSAGHKWLPEECAKRRGISKALLCLKTVCEALEWLLLVSVRKRVSSSLLRLCSTSSSDRQNLDLALQDDSTLINIRHYLEYQDKVRKGHLGKTAVFWLSVTDHGRLVFMLLFSVKTNNLALFHKCKGDMAGLFFAFDGQNYSRQLY